MEPSHTGDLVTAPALASGADDVEDAAEVEEAIKVAPPWVEVGPELAQLASAYGVATEYWDQSGNLHRISAVTVEAVLAAFGVEADSPEACEAALAAKRLDHWRRMLPPVFVMQQGAADAVTWVHVRDGAEVRLWVELENGAYRHDLVQVDNWTPATEVGGVMVGEASFRLPGDLPLGWHVLRAASEERTGAVPLVVSPARLDAPTGADDPRAWGLAVQLYAARSRRSWGVGDLGDLADMAWWSGRELGADFVQVNPLHAGEPVPPLEPSPYLPVTRRFFSPLYIRVEAIAEMPFLGDADLATVRELAATARAGDTPQGLIDRDAVWSAKRSALELVWGVPRAPGRDAAYEAFRAREGEGLLDYATWAALAEVHGADYQVWPEELRRPHAPAVAAARVELADRIDFHCWLQWVIDEQLEEAQRAASAADMRLGVMHDLAVGVSPRGADAWALQDVLASAITVGAPPDAFNQMGQDWSQPPWRPDALAASAFIPYRDMLRTLLRNAGALRIDHVLGLFRLWWIPDGMPPSAGTYVRFDHDALVNILVLEAHRAGAVIIGEDLGTVEQWVQDLLAGRGILGTTILWFERYHGHVHPIEQWRSAAMASVTVHDLPPTAGYLAGAHVALRDRLGLLARPPEEEWADFHREIDEWRGYLVSRGLLRPDADDDDMVVALHRLVAQSPARLIAVALPDTVGDVRPQNQPGTHREYPNWRLPLADADGHVVDLDAIPASPMLRRIVDAVGG